MHLNTNNREDRTVSVIDDLGNKQSSSYNPDEQAESLTDPNGQGITGASTVLAYTGALSENVTKVTAPADATNTAGTTNLAYDDTTNNPYLPTSVTDSSKRCTRYVYSSSGDLTDSYSGIDETSGGSSPDCSSTSGGTHNHVDYNSDGTVRDSYGPDGSWTSTDDSHATVYTYYSSGTTTGQPEWVGQPGGTRPGSGATCSSTTTLCTGFTYDSLDRVQSVTDGNNNTKTYHYDAMDRVLELDLGGATSCNGGHTNCYSYTYDGEGNITSVTDTSNRTRTIGYDRLNRQTSITVPGTSYSITDSYDGVGNLTSYADGSDSVGYSYDAADHLDTITDAAGTFNVTTDSDGNRTGLSLPTGGVTIHTDYHQNGQVHDIYTSGGTGLPGQFTYTYTDGSGNEREQVQKLTVVGQPDANYGYDLNGRLCWVGTGAFSSCSGTTNRSYSYTYDGEGDRTSSSTSSATTYFGYRLNGELCYSGATDGTDVARDCPTTPSGDTTYANDNAGNLTGTSTSTGLLSYNNDNQVTTAAPLSGSGTSATADYLDQGNDLRYSVSPGSDGSGSTDNYDNGPLGVTTMTTTGGTTGTIVTHYTRDPDGNLIDERSSTSPTGCGTPSGSATNYYLLDRQHSVVGLISSTGTNAGEYHYTPFGRVTNALTAATCSNPFRYTGGLQDATSGYYHLGARYYDQAMTATFTQPDSVVGSIASPKTLNLYVYTQGDPINGVDPTGRFDIGSFVEGIDFGVESLGTFFVAAGTIAAGCALTGGLACGVGIAAGVAIGSGGVALGYLSYHSFRDAFSA